MRPLIVITAGYDFKKPDTPFEYTARIGRSYAEAVARAGGIPVLMAWEEDDGLLDLADGVLFSGGVDMDPAIYGEECFNDTVEICHLRDRVELALVKRCIERKIPAFGICRGIQTLNVALGGSLWQDIPGQNPEAVAHAAGAAHEVRAEAGTFMAELFGEHFSTNSYHHQAIKALGEGLNALAWSPDGYVEAVEHTSLPIFATQWHPERMTASFQDARYPDMAPMFERFVEMARTYGLEKTLAGSRA